MYEGPNLRIFDSVLNPMLNSPSGMVGKRMKKYGLMIVIGAKGMVGVRSGQLRRNIYYRQGVRSKIQFVRVVANTKYAHAHHDGTSRHHIRSRTGRVMRFNVGGRVVYAHKVAHPGTKPNKFLTTPMRRVVK